LIRRFAHSTLLLLGLTLIVASAAADTLGDAFSEWARPGDPLTPPTDARELSLQFLEWELLADWVRADVGGEDPGELPGLWARLNRLRDDAGELVGGELQRHQRGLCLFEQLKLEGPALLVYCDSLTVGRHDPVRYLYAGLLTGHLLADAGLPGCGREDSGVSALAGNLGRIPRRNLEQIKEGRDYADHFFAAEHVLEALRAIRLERVREFLSSPGRLISLKYGVNPPRRLQPDDDGERLDADHWLFPAGIVVEWDRGRRLEVHDLAVLHTPGQNLFQVVEPGGMLWLEQDGERLETPSGSFELEEPTSLVGENLRIDLDRGRYRMDEVEIRLWFAGGFLDANRKELFFTILVVAAIVFMLGNIRRQRHKLAEPMKIRRPGRPD
jgi:hypothetical protein